MEFIVLLSILFVFLVIKGFFDRKNAKKRLRASLAARFGKLPEATELTEEKYRSLQCYYKSRIAGKNPSVYLLDEITWNDLDMDYLFTLINATNSSMGEEYLWAILHELELTGDGLAERERVITFFMESPAERLRIQMALAMIGKNKKSSVYGYMEQMENVKRESNITHYAVLFLMAAGLFLLPVSGILGGGILVACVVFNIISYYKRKGETAPYFTAFSYIIRMLNHAAELSKENIPAISAYTAVLKAASESLRPLRKGAPVVAAQSITGDMMSLLLDYIRILFHTDLIRFNCMMKQFVEQKAAIIEVFETIGFLDAMCAAASFRMMLPYYAVPELGIKERRLCAEKLYHPFLEEPVPSDIETTQSVLVTGSNASGKSTFLKAAAINAILAQTLHTACAKAYQAAYFRVMSSMALSDNLLAGESYYIVEIRSLQRILTAAGWEGAPVLCFVDEVLRGTNTVERIAASSRILHSVACGNALIFAATHDIELTYMLEGTFVNYHFEEQIKDNQILFDYQLKYGRATSQNAIQLLALLGYPEEIIAKARETAAGFLLSGEWRKTE